MTMSFFGKLKSLHSGPPAPPRRTSNNVDFVWPQDEFDEEEGDMYEAPPCERPAVKVPPRHVEENVYLETTSSPAVQQRQATPPRRLSKFLVTIKYPGSLSSSVSVRTRGLRTGKKPQQRSKEFCFDPNTKKPPEIDRNDKPGRKKIMAPPPVRSAPLPVSNVEEDVYLDPNEEPEDVDALYLEPAAACPPVHRAPIRMPPSPKTLLPSSIPMMKPPVPRAESNSFLPPLNDIKTAPPFEARHASFPTKLPPPTPTFKPPLPANLKEVKLSTPNPHIVDTKPTTSSGVMRATKQFGDEDREWFAGECNRKTAEDLLQTVNKDGAFLIRYSSAQNARQPFTLAVLYQQKVYNIPIRFLEDTQGYALGKEGKKNEEIFTSLDEMITHHKNNQLLLIDSKSRAKHTAYLTHPARR